MMQTPDALIIGEGDIGGLSVTRLIKGSGLNAIETLDGNAACYKVEEKTPAIVIVTSVSSDMTDGLHYVRQIRKISADIPIVMMSRYSCEDRVLLAFRSGINDYFSVPLENEEVVRRIRKCLNGHSPPLLKTLNNNGSARLPSPRLVGSSKSMQQIRSYLEQVARTDTTVLITGETGTGKELAADLIHKTSSRRGWPFVSINCAALPDTLVESELFGYDSGAFTGARGTKQGKFELATGGIVFLDEIGDMPASAQAKLLRVIENKTVIRLGGRKNIPLEVRIIAATNKDPERMVSLGKFRDDLYYRLNVVRVHLPPLRDRKEDIEELAGYCIDRLNLRYDGTIKGVTHAALAAMSRHGWPGNVRELFNLLEAVYVDPPKGKIDLQNLPLQFRRKLKKINSTAGHERGHIVSALLSTNWRKTEAAKKLNWSRMTLYRKIIKYKIVEHRHPSR